MMNKELEILTIASGNKCLGGSKMCPNGTVVNDSHAEVLARRAFKLLLWKIILNNICIEINPKILTNLFYHRWHRVHVLNILLVFRIIMVVTPPNLPPWM